eukprot:493296_1
MIMAVILCWLIFTYVSAQTPSCTPPPYDDLCIFADNYCLRYYSNINVSTTNTITASKAIIVVHGSQRNADDYYCAMQVSAQIQGYNVMNKDIIIIAPRFMEHSDSPKSNELYWDEHWKTGSNSLVPINNQIASFSVVDTIIELLTINRTFLYPNLVNITIVGHSAGGQFCQRYALTSPITNIVNLNKYNLKFVPSNPSSFCYLDSRRWFNDESFRELTTTEKTSCSGYNNWIYGYTGNLPPYIINQNLTLELAKQRYIARNITYLHGTNDVCNGHLNSSCEDGGLDTTCPAMIQGTYRLERGINFLRSLQEIFGKFIHRIDFVPFVGHDHWDMFQHANGRRAIF